MARIKNLRKARFRAALAFAEMTQDAWARQEGIAPSMLSLLLDGKRESSEILAKVEAFTAKHLKSVTANVA